jgi:hypothetical protein
MIPPDTVGEANSSRGGRCGQVNVEVDRVVVTRFYVLSKLTASIMEELVWVSLGVVTETVEGEAKYFPFIRFHTRLPDMGFHAELSEYPAQINQVSFPPTPVTLSEVKLTLEWIEEYRGEHSDSWLSNLYLV